MEMRVEQSIESEKELQAHKFVQSLTKPQICNNTGIMDYITTARESATLIELQN